MLSTRSPGYKAKQGYGDVEGKQAREWPEEEKSIAREKTIEKGDEILNEMTSLSDS